MGMEALPGIILVDDTVDGVMKALHYLMQKQKLYEIFNLGNNNPIRLIDLVECIQEITGKKPIIQQEQLQPGEVNHTCADITKAQKFLGYEPRTNFKEGLQNFTTGSEKQQSIRNKKG